MYDEAKVEADIEAFLETELSHAGVKGMKWGKRKAKATGLDAKAPSVAKAALLGIYGKKSSYTDPAALAMRQKAGKLRVASILTAVGATGIQAASKGNAGGMAVAGILNTAAGGLNLGGAVTAARAANTEQNARNN